MSLKDPTVSDPTTVNDSSDNWCTEPSTTTYGDGDSGTPGAASVCGAGPPPPVLPTPFTGAIYAIQGSGASSPHVGEDLTTIATTNDNIVTAVGAGGFFIQTPTADSDNDADTSDGIFVLYDGTTMINVGDQVDVTGEVEESYDFTRINATTSVTDASVTLDASNQTLPAPVEFGSTVPSPDPANPSCAIEYECYEGMRIRIATGTVNSGSQFFRSDPVAESTSRQRPRGRSAKRAWSIRATPRTQPFRSGTAIRRSSNSTRTSFATRTSPGSPGPRSAPPAFSATSSVATRSGRPN